MEPRRSRLLGMAMSAAGTATIVLAILLFGVTQEDGGGADWVSVITAVAGFAVAAIGLYTLFRNKGPATGGRTPHAAA